MERWRDGWIDGRQGVKGSKAGGEACKRKKREASQFISLNEKMGRNGWKYIYIDRVTEKASLISMVKMMNK